MLSMMCAGMMVLNVAAAAAPITRNPAAWVKSPRMVDRNTRQPDCPSARTGTRGFIHSGRPIRSQIQPTITAVSSPAINLAHTMFGSLVNATAVAISTIGLIAGADSMNASDADGRTPRSISRLEIGTDPHSQPGSAAPHTLATGTARAALLGMIRVKNAAGHERGDRPGHHDAEHQERGGLHTDGDEDRRPALHDGMPEERLQRPAKDDGQQQDRAEDLQRTWPVALLAVGSASPSASGPSTSAAPVPRPGPLARVGRYRRALVSRTVIDSPHCPNHRRRTR